MLSVLEDGRFSPKCLAQREQSLLAALPRKLSAVSQYRTVRYLGKFTYGSYCLSFHAATSVRAD